MIHYWAYNGVQEILAAMWRTHDMKVALMKQSWVPTPDTAMNFAALQAANEIIGTGYTAGGISLSGKATPYNAAADRTDFQAADVTWGPGATFQCWFATVYDNTDANKLIWSVINFEVLKDISAGSFTVDFSSTGLLFLAP